MVYRGLQTSGVRGEVERDGERRSLQPDCVRSLRGGSPGKGEGTSLWWCLCTQMLGNQFKVMTLYWVQNILNQSNVVLS